jgi:tripartite-type tricarboxylate transporter receptor subunit TctC
MSLAICHRAKIIVLSILLLIAAVPAAAQEFFNRKTVVVLVGTAAGGGFDTYSRMMARHLGKHIPGNPSIIVQNMPGAGQLIAANHLYNRSAPDGFDHRPFLRLGNIPPCTGR